MVERREMKEIFLLLDMVSDIHNIHNSRTIKYMLENPFYKGINQYKDNKFKNIQIRLFL